MNSLQQLLRCVKDGNIAEARSIASAIEVPLNARTVTSASEIYRAETVLSLEAREFVILYALARRNKILKRIELFSGGISSCILDPRIAFRELLLIGADTCILVHNHPSGEPDPSPEDIRITEQFRAAGDVVDIKLRDHVIVSAKGYYSFLDSTAILN